MAFTVSAYVTRSYASALQLENDGIFRVVTIGAGPLSWRRTQVDSPYVHGSTLVAAAKENPVLPLSIAVFGTSQNTLESRIATLLRAFEQFSYNLHLTVDGVNWEWRCYPADYSPNADGSFNSAHMRELVQVYNFRIPRDPIPVHGAH